MHNGCLQVVESKDFDDIGYYARNKQDIVSCQNRRGQLAALMLAHGANWYLRLTLVILAAAYYRRWSCEPYMSVCLLVRFRRCCNCKCRLPQPIFNYTPMSNGAPPVQTVAAEEFLKIWLFSIFLRLNVVTTRLVLGRTTLLSGGGVAAWSSISFRYIVAKDDLDISTTGTNVFRREGGKTSSDIGDSW